MAVETTEQAGQVAEHAEHALTPASYIAHHLSFLQQPVGPGGFWTLNVDTLITSAVLGAIVFGFLYWVASGATAGLPGKKQAFVEYWIDYINDQTRSMFNRDISFLAPLALTVFVWVFFMNAMDFLPVDIVSKGLALVGVHEFRMVPTADINTTFALALTV